MNYDRVAEFRTSSPPIAGWKNTIQQIFRDYPGSLAVRLWTGETIFVGRTMPHFTLVFKSPAVFRDTILRRDPMQLAHAYFSGELDVEGDPYRALDLRTHLGKQQMRFTEKLLLLAKILSISLADPRPQHHQSRRPFTNGHAVRQSLFGAKERTTHSREQNERSIAFHYDVPSEFYRLWLDEQMVYSCAYFESAGHSLDTAQTAKLNHICRKLRLKPGEQFLDMGCGWGALAIHAAKHYGVHATGVTLSHGQYEWARRRVFSENLEDKVTIEFLDYRDIAGAERFDKVASVGMFEHVGLKNLPAYFNTIHRLLKPGGLLLNHGITHDEEGWNPSLSTDFINRYVFPDGELDTLSNVQRQMEKTQFEIWDVEGLRQHYALTLRNWVSRLEAARAEALRYVDEATYRVWRLYMAASALHFEEGDLGIYQILASKRTPQVVPVPMTRRDLYRT